MAAHGRPWCSTTTDWISLLREVRRRGERPLGSMPLRVCAADPLNFQGILTPDAKVPASAAYAVAVG